MALWVDPFTRWKYRLPEGCEADLRRVLARELAQELGKAKGLKEKADRAARFWRGLYRRIFPLRYGPDGGDPWQESGPGELVPAGSGWRLTPEGAGTPPVLPAPDGWWAGGEGELLPDAARTAGALMNLAHTRIREREPDSFHRLRLAALISPLVAGLSGDAGLDEPTRALAYWMADPTARPAPQEATPAARWLVGGVPAEPPAELPRGEFLHGTVTRIQTWLYETPGLNEIRGGSELLEWACLDFAEELADRFGPELWIRCAASTVEFLLPEGSAVEAGQSFRRKINRALGLGLARVGTADYPLADLRAGYLGVVGTAHRDLAAHLAAAPPPEPEVLPFAARCAMCENRPVSTLVALPEQEVGRVCRCCATRREWGRERRGRRLQEVLRFSGRNGEELAEAGDPYPSDLESLIPRSTRYQAIAAIYGDGNNFGKIVQRELGSPGRAVQWTERVGRVTETAASVAAAEAVERARRLGHRFEQLPYQVLTLGGDDLCLLSWAGAALPFAARFTELTDREFEPAGPEGERITFSLGVAVSDRKAPIRRLVEHAHEELLKGWAKKERSSDSPGKVAYVLTRTVEQIPGDLVEYRENYLLGREDRQGNRCRLTFRPYTARQLQALLGMAERPDIRNAVGPLQGLVQAVSQATPLQAELHYLYQRARHQGRRDSHQGRLLKALEERHWLQGLELKGLPYSPEPGGYVTPLGDLLEIVKLES